MSICVSVGHMCMVTAETRKGVWFLRVLGGLSYLLWVLGTGPRSSERAATLLSVEAYLQFHK